MLGPVPEVECRGAIRQISEDFFPEVKQLREEKEKAHREASDRIYDPFLP